jgi:formate dehydrogenase iron-sulfur subunit
VSHLDDQCIGCSYCTLTCPYEVPAYDHRRGIVRKCDMCAGRLAEGEAPACVQGCPNGAIEITVVDIAATVVASVSGALVPGAPPSGITVPSTVYRSARGFGSGEVAAPPAPAEVARAHPPLTVMLVLTQLAVGAFVLHLGRPLHCYRAVIGLRHSWLSREVVAFGAFTGLALPYAFVIVAMPDALGSSATRALGLSVAAAGVVGVACSVLIYTRTRRASWTVPAVAAKFTLTAGACGVATVLWMSSAGASIGAGSGLESRQTEHFLFLAIAVLMATKLAGEAVGFRYLRRPEHPEHPEGARRARVLTGPLRTATWRRFGLGVGAGVALPLLAAVTADGPTSSLVSAALATLVLAGVVAGELIERTLFFTASSAPR